MFTKSVFSATRNVSNSPQSRRQQPHKRRSVNRRSNFKLFQKYEQNSSNLQRSTIVGRGVAFFTDESGLLVEVEGLLCVVGFEGDEMEDPIHRVVRPHHPNIPAQRNDNTITKQATGTRQPAISRQN